MIAADLLLTTIALLGLSAATINDLKTREVPDWITYGLIGAGFGIRFIAVLAGEHWSYLLLACISLVITYILGNIMYYTRQWGGGDAKMLMALGVVFATRPYFLPQSSMPFLVVVFTNIIIFGALYGIIWGFFLAWKNRKEFLTEVKKWLQEKKMIHMRTYAVITATILVLFCFTIEDIILRIGLLSCAVMILLYPYLWIGVKVIEKTCLFKYVSPKELTEGDWVEKDILIKKKIIYKAKNTGIEKEDIQKLIKYKIKKVLIKEGIPFIPPFLIGTIVTLLKISIFNSF